MSDIVKKGISTRQKGTSLRERAAFQPKPFNQASFLGFLMKIKFFSSGKRAEASDSPTHFSSKIGPGLLYCSTDFKSVVVVYVETFWCYCL